MRFIANAGRLIAAGSLVTALAGCSGTAAALSCDEIARQAREASETQGARVDRFKDIREDSATDTERRCIATAEVNGMGDVTVYLRGYEDASGNQMVAFQDTPFEGDGTE